MGGTGDGPPTRSSAGRVAREHSHAAARCPPEESTILAGRERAAGKMLPRLRALRAGPARVRKRWEGKGELAANDGDFALYAVHAIGQRADVRFQPCEQADLHADDDSGRGHDGGADLHRDGARLPKWLEGWHERR